MIYLNQPFEEDDYIFEWRELVFFNSALGPLYSLYRVFELHGRGPEWAPQDHVMAVAWRRGID